MNKVSINQELTKAGVSALVNQIETRITEGKADGLDALVLAKFLEECAKNIRKSKTVAESADDEIGKYNKGESPTRSGAIITKNSRPKYDFSNSPGVSEIEEQMKTNKWVMKEMQDAAKKLQAVAFFTHPETGESLEVRPAKKEVTDVFSIKLKN